LATENKNSLLLNPENKIESITSHVGCAHSGMGPDSRLFLLLKSQL